MKNKKLIFIIAGALIGIIFIFGLVKINELNRKLSTMKMLADKDQNEAERLRAEKDKLSKERDKLQADAVSYLASNSQLQDDKERLEKNINDFKNILGNKDAELQLVKGRMEKIEKANKEENAEFSAKQKAEKAHLENKVRELEGALKKEKGAYFYNLGVIYAEQEKYQEAFDAFRKSLQFDPENAEALYNIAILYEKSEDNPKKAVECYKKLLQLNPKPEDINEIKEAIKRLEQQ